MLHVGYRMLMAKGFISVSNRLGLMLVCALALGIVACNPCRELADQICACYDDNAKKKQACIRRVEQTAASVSPSDAQKEQCKRLIQSCSSCEKIEANPSACGLAR